MENFFRTQVGRLSLALGGIDLALLGIASSIQDPGLTATEEIGDLFPIGLFSMLLFLLGVFVYGLTNATFAGPAAGVMSISVGVLFALLGAWPAELTVERRIERTV